MTYWIVFNDTFGFHGIKINNPNAKYIEPNDYRKLFGITEDEISEFNAHSSDVETFDYFVERASKEYKYEMFTIV
jgi:hypothetical protein